MYFDELRIGNYSTCYECTNVLCIRIECDKIHLVYFQVEDRARQDTMNDEILKMQVRKISDIIYKYIIITSNELDDP
jgi:hypothetical protein